MKVYYINMESRSLVKVVEFTDTDFRPVHDNILNDNRWLNIHELERITDSIDEVNKLIESCGPNDDDVLNYYISYLTRCKERVERSMSNKPKRKRNAKKNS